MSLKNIFGSVGGKLIQNQQSFSGVDSPPWSNNEDSFFSPIDLDPNRADGIYPYRLLVINIKDNSIVSGGASGYGTGGIVQKVLNKSNTGGVQYLIGAESSWTFTLPITPQQLSITDQFAINTTATMRGVVEEHNGVKFKIISASGTTGIWPTRGGYEDLNTPGLSLAGGTIAAFQGAVNAFSNILDGKEATKTPDPVTEDPTRTGYYQALLLQQFLEQYAMAKKDPANKDWRLVFDCPKTNESFVVTPMQYSVTRSQRSPIEFNYSMQFKAWKRVKLGGSPQDVEQEPIPLDAGWFQKAVSTLDNARSAMSASINIIKAVRSDYRQVFDQIRKVTLLIKDVAGLAFAVSDMPNQLVKDINASVKKLSADLSQSSDLFQATFKKSYKRNKGSEKKIKNTVSSIKKNKEKNEGVSDEQIEAGVLGPEAKQANRASSLNKVFDEPESNFDFFNALSLSSLALTPKQSFAIQDEVSINSLLSIEEIKEIRRDLQSLILDLTNNFGAGDAFFAEVFDRPAPKERATPMTLEEFELVRSLEEIVLTLNTITATRSFDDSRKQSPLEYIGGLAQDSGIQFSTASVSKILVPVPYNLTIEQISARYLGTPERYNEIITLNNLRSPYIDEDGFFYNFLSNGDGRQFNINSKNNLYVGQKIQLFSNTVSIFTRKITAIEKISDTNYLITVDGVDNLGILKTLDNAKMKGYLPGTVNSQNQIYIPSNIPVSAQSRTYDIPFLKEDPLTGFSKIDWLLDDSGDVVINSFGEVALANGTTNLVQALKMKISTQKGSLLSYPQFGLGLTPGVNVSEIDIENVLKDLRDMVTQDPRFSGVQNIELNILPPEVSISINAILANGNGIFPINFTL